VGSALGSALVGFYSMAFLFARLPLNVIAGPLQYVVYAQLAKTKDDNAAIARAYLLITRLLAVLVFPAMGMVAAAHTPVFTLLLSEKWHDAGVLFMLLAPACAVQAVFSISETVLYSLNHSKRQLRIAIESTLLWVVALFVAVSFGIKAAAMTYTLCTLLYLPRGLSLLLPLLALRMRDYFATYGTTLAATALGIAAYTLIAANVPLSNWLLFGLALLLALAALATSAWLQRALLAEEIHAWKLGAAENIKVLPEEVAAENLFPR
jgi:O-antigen/teichoic acid export membrane protein